MIMQLVSFLLVFLFGCALFAIWYKGRRVHLKLYELENILNNKSDALFAEIEALINLRGLLGIEKELPATRGWAASPDFLLTIVRHTLNNAPHRIIECSSGVSTLVLARAVKLNGSGHVYSLEHDANYAEVTRENLEKYGLDSYATVIDAPLKQYNDFSWYDLDNIIDEDKFDMLVVDGPPDSTGQLARYPAMQFLYKKMNVESYFFIDDYDRDDEKRMVDIWLSEHAMVKEFSGFHEKGCAILRKQTE